MNRKIYPGFVFKIKFLVMLFVNEEQKDNKRYFASRQQLRIVAPDAKTQKGHRRKSHVLLIQPAGQIIVSVYLSVC